MRDRRRMSRARRMLGLQTDDVETEETGGMACLFSTFLALSQPPSSTFSPFPSPLHLPQHSLALDRRAISIRHSPSLRPEPPETPTTRRTHARNMSSPTTPITLLTTRLSRRTRSWTISLHMAHTTTRIALLAISGARVRTVCRLVARLATVVA